MENLVVSVFNTESEAYQSFCGFEGFPPNSDDQGCSNRLGQNENSHIVEKERYDFEDSTTDATLEGGLLGAVIGLLGGLSASCLVMVLAASMVWLLVIPLIRQKLRRLTLCLKN